MRRFWQTEWHGISFSSFHPLSSYTLADSDFYDSFYRTLFEKYSCYASLDEKWRYQKDQVADWLMSIIPCGARVLSVGCGLGYIEQRLWRQYPGFIDLHVSDYSTCSLEWLKQILPAERIHESIASESGFDIIYLCAVDYALPSDEIIVLLAKLRQSLRQGGQIIIISASYLDNSLLLRLFRDCKDVCMAFLDVFRIRSRGQFWGWMRSKYDYHSLMRRAGLLCLSDGFLVTSGRKTYWVMARAL